MRRAKTGTIIEAMRILAEDIQSEDGIANAAIREAADRLHEMNAETERLGRNIDMLKGQIARQSEEIARLRAALMRAALT